MSLSMLTYIGLYDCDLILREKSARCPFYKFSFKPLKFQKVTLFNILCRNNNSDYFGEYQVCSQYIPNQSICIKQDTRGPFKIFSNLGKIKMLH